MIERLFLRAPNWVGDVVMATPTLAALRARYPRARITVGVRPYLRGVLRGLESLYDELLPCPRPKGLAGFFAEAGQWRARGFDAALLLPSSLEVVLLAAAAGIPRRYAYARGGNAWLLTSALRSPSFRGKRIPRPSGQTFADLAGLLDVPVHDERPRLVYDLATRAAWHERARALGLDLERPYAALNPGASYGSSKFWSVAGFARTAELLRERFGLQALVTVGPGEEPLARGIAEQARVPIAIAVDPVLDLHALKPAVAGASLLVTTDTGTRHYGTAFDVPTVVLMGPTDPRFTLDHLERQRVLRRELPCAPCHAKSCPLQHHACMQELSAEMVLSAAEELLEGASAEAHA
ncbi:MAG: lipopolysaccharide heptosyltransferase II [Planctomycetes bacterium]|nr:lipopolysaccharide heptosyltransferase II [Planctomycetota bacterium]